MIREIQSGGSGPGRTGGGTQLPMPMLQDMENGGEMVIPAGEDAGRYREMVAKHYGRLFGRNVLCMKAVNRLVFLVGGSRDASREVEDDGQWMDRCFTLSGLQRQLRKKGVEKALGDNRLSAYAVRWLDDGCLSILVGSMRRMVEKRTSEASSCRTKLLVIAPYKSKFFPEAYRGEIFPVSYICL